MKKNRYKVMIAVILCLFSYLITAQEPEKKETWDYPVKPGSREWASFTTGKQMVDACQIPNHILKSLSTKELVEICFNYPLFLDYAAANDERKGISHMIEIFNGLNELSFTTKTVRQQNTVKCFIENFHDTDESLLTDMSKIISEL